MKEGFNKRLTKYRELLGYSTKQMAEYLQMKEADYTEYECGSAEPDLEKLVCISDVLGCMTDELLGRGGSYKCPSVQEGMVREQQVPYGQKKKLMIGLQDFRKLRELDAYYVDKTRMIAEFMSSWYQITLITRPRRFGKTMNMSMLAEFLDCTKDSGEIFAGTEISGTDYMKEMNQHPVVYLSFLNIKSDNENELFELLGRAVKTEYERYRFLKKANGLPKEERKEFNDVYERIADIREMEQWRFYFIKSITTLCRILKLYYGKNVYLFIDEYDTPFMSANTNGYYQEIRSVLAGFFSTSLKGNPYLERALLTGIQRVAKENIFSGLNNLVVLTAADSEYEACFGFTEAEVRDMLEYYDLHFSDEIKEMYDGYRFGAKDMYNPWSITNYAAKRKLGSYWVNTSENSILKDALAERGTALREEYNELIEKGEIKTVATMTTAYYEQQSDASLWGLMVNAGMLTIKEDLGDNYYILRIPNQEVWSAFRELTAFSLQVDEGDMQNALQNDIGRL